MSAQSAESDAAQCNGICVMAYEILPGHSGVAYPHPDCDEHAPQQHPCCRRCVAEPGEDHPTPHTAPCGACVAPPTKTGGVS